MESIIAVQPGSYQIYDYQLVSDIALPELPVCKLPQAQTIKLFANKIDLDDAELIYHWEEDQGLDLLYYRSETEILLEFSNKLLVAVNADTLTVSYQILAENTLSNARHLLLDQVIPRLVAHHRGLVLHASCIERDGHAIAFVGESGAGKSTLAAWLSQQPGNTLICDDSILLLPDDNQIKVIPGYGGVRLLEASADALYADLYSPLSPPSNQNSGMSPENTGSSDGWKVRINAASRSLPSQLGGIYYLNGNSSTAAVHEDRSVAFIMLILQQAFSLDPKNYELSQSRMKLISSILPKTAFTGTINLPHKFDLLPEIGRLIHLIE